MQRTRHGRWISKTSPDRRLKNMPKKSTSTSVCRATAARKILSKAIQWTWRQRRSSCNISGHVYISPVAAAVDATFIDLDEFSGRHFFEFRQTAWLARGENSELQVFLQSSPVQFHGQTLFSPPAPPVQVAKNDFFVTCFVKNKGRSPARIPRQNEPALARIPDRDGKRTHRQPFDKFFTQFKVKAGNHRHIGFIGSTGRPRSASH